MYKKQNDKIELALTYYHEMCLGGNLTQRQARRTVLVVLYILGLCKSGRKGNIFFMQRFLPLYWHYVDNL